ncbi:MAG TPA: hypothetical protein VIX83_12370 [Candidatus Cybelea sp.]
MAPSVRCVVAVVVAASLAGCAGAQTGRSLIGSATSPLVNSGFWIRPEAKLKNLIYVSLPALNSVDVFEYPSGALVGELNGLDDPQGLCADAHGNVWIANADNGRGNGYLVEYAHGGSDPIATLQDPQNAPEGCSVDISSGNLAVANVPAGSEPNIAVYPKATGAPAYYSTAGIVKQVQTIAYDGFGDLYFADWKDHFGWLRAGGSQTMKFSLRPAPKTNGAIQWDGLELAVLANPKTPYAIWRYNVKGNPAERSGIVQLKGAQWVSQFWISKGALAAASRPGVWLFNYPSGGPSNYLIKQPLGAYGVTISNAN